MFANKLAPTTKMQEAIIKRHEEKFSQVLKWFKPPNRSSKEVVLSGKIGFRGRVLEVDRNQRDFILQISELLVRHLSAL